MFTHIAHDLRRSVKPHRLRIQQGTAEDGRVMAFQPGRHIDQHGKGRRVAFGKAVIGETFDLAETTLGHVGRIAIRQHPRDEFVPIGPDGAHAPERSQRPAQVVGLFRREVRPDHGDLHGLFLKQRHTQRARRYLFERCAKGGCLLQIVAPPDIGLHHIALNRSGAHNRHLDHQIIKGPGPHPGQEVHLGPAFHLKDANRIRTAQHVIGGRIFLWDGRDPKILPLVPGHQIKGFAQAAQHPKPQNIDLQNPQRVNVILVPADDRAILHRRVFDRGQLVQPPAGDDKAANMLG